MEFDTKFMIRAAIVLHFAIIVCAMFGVGKSYELIVEGWEGLAAFLGILVGGKTFERAKEITGKAEVAKAEALASSPVIAPVGGAL